MKGVGLPLHTRLRTAAVPELIHKQIVCPSLGDGSSGREGWYVAGEAACAQGAGMTGPILTPSP